MSSDCCAHRMNSFIRWVVISVRHRCDTVVREYNRLGTMADLAIIVRSSNQNMCEKWIFSEFVTKTAVAFRLVLQFTANHLGSRKSANIHFHRLLVFAATLFLFWSCNSLRKIYTWLTKSVFTAYIGLSLVVGDIDYFLPSKLSVSKYTGKINILSAQKPGVYWNESLRFFFCPRHLQLTAEPGKMRLGSFYNKSTNFFFFFCTLFDC